MSKKLLNLTLVVVTKELDLLWEHSPLPTHTNLFNQQDLRQQLIEYVLNRIPNIYSVVEELSTNQIDYQLLSYSPSAQQQIKTLIHQGFKQVFAQENTAINRLSLSSCVTKQ